MRSFICIPSEAKATSVLGFYGTAKAVPFQINSLFRSL
jgi:hypothetical protein